MSRETGHIIFTFTSVENTIKCHIMFVTGNFHEKRLCMYNIVYCQKNLWTYYTIKIVLNIKYIKHPTYLHNTFVTISRSIRSEIR